MIFQSFEFQYYNDSEALIKEKKDLDEAREFIVKQTEPKLFETEMELILSSSTQKQAIKEIDRTKVEINKVKDKVEQLSTSELNEKDLKETRKQLKALIKQTQRSFLHQMLY